MVRTIRLHQALSRGLGREVSGDGKKSFNAKDKQHWHVDNG